MRLHQVTGFAVLVLLCGCSGMDTTHERQPGQVVVCHDGKTLNVSNPDYLRHAEHGDRAGPCP